MSFPTKLGITSVDQAAIWAYPSRVITGGAPIPPTPSEIWASPTRTMTEETDTGTAPWLKASGTTETLILEVAASVREVVIDISEMGSVEPGTQVLTFRIYRYIDTSWVFDDSVDVVPSEKDVMTVSDVHGQVRITLEPDVETQQDYSLPYTLYYQ